MGHSRVGLAQHPAFNSGCEWLVKEELQQGKQRKNFPEDICQLIASVSLGQFLSQWVLPYLPRHSSLPLKLYESIHCCHERADRNRVPAAASGCWQSCMGLFHFSGYISSTSINSMRDGVLTLNKPFTSGNCAGDQKLLSQGLGDIMGIWECWGSRRLQLPCSAMFSLSPVFPHPTGLAACAQGQLWYCTVQVWAVSNTSKTWSRVMDYTR